MSLRGTGGRSCGRCGGSDFWLRTSRGCAPYYWVFCWRWLRRWLREWRVCLLCLAWNWPVFRLSANSVVHCHIHGHNPRSRQRARLREREKTFCIITRYPGIITGQGPHNGRYHNIHHDQPLASHPLIDARVVVLQWLSSYVKASPVPSSGSKKAQTQRKKRPASKRRPDLRCE